MTEKPTRRGLTPYEEQALWAALRPYRDGFQSVILFGSRATGKATARSDIDLAIVGARDASVVDRLYTALLESALPVSVDVVDYDRLKQPRLKAHIDAVGVTLEAPS